MKDIARVNKVPVSIVNYMTAMLEDNMSWTDLFLFAAQGKPSSKKMAAFINKYPKVFEDIRALMFQPRSASIHASAIIVTPDKRDGVDMECFDYTPIKKVDGLLVSEFDGYTIDAVGLLKNDVLATKELSKIQATLALCNKHYNAGISFEGLVTGDMDDRKAYSLLAQGYTQNVFQLSSKGMTKFLMDMQPTNIHDIIAANALYRPATIESGSVEKYVDSKNGVLAPVYLWGTYNALKDTFGLLCVKEGSLVTTIKGLIPIEQVSVDDMVLTDDGSFQRVIRTMCSGHKRTVTVRTSHGEALTLTPDHKVLTQNGWVCAGDLIPKYHMIKGFWMSEESKAVGTMKDWCLGFYLANGTYGKNGSSKIACRSESDARIVCGVFNSEFGLECQVRFDTRCWYVILSHRRIGFSSINPFKQYLRDIGLKGKGAKDKFFPTAPTLMMIAGFIEGDGCTVNGLVRLSNSTMAKQLMLGLQSYRIPSSYYEKTESSGVVFSVSFNDNSTRKLPYILKTHNSEHNRRKRGVKVPAKYLSGTDLKFLPKGSRVSMKQAIANNSPCFLETVKESGAVVDHDLWGLVLSVSPDTDLSMTYDISVENNHNFCVNGIIAHNCYQEDLMRISQDVGGFSLTEGVKLMKLVSKKKPEEIHKMKVKFMEGALKKGCPEDEAEKIWEMIESGGSYLFNKSHATAYGVTAYVGAWLKANYPTAFYTVAFQWAKDDEIPALMSEMEQCSIAKIVPPDVNMSGSEFFTNYETNQIFWSITRIKQVGVKAVDWIVAEREKNGEFTSLKNFIHRVFKYKLKKYEYWDDPDNEDEAVKCPVNARHIRNMICSGCFDKTDNIRAGIERWRLIQEAAKELGFEVKEEEFPSDKIDKHYFWSALQVELSGVGSIDYRRIYDNSDARQQLRGKVSCASLKDCLRDDYDGKKVAICANVIEVKEIGYTDKQTKERKTFVKVQLQQNNDLIELVAWDDFYNSHKPIFTEMQNRIVIVSAMVRYSDYTGANGLQTFKSSHISLI